MILTPYCIVCWDCHETARFFFQKGLVQILCWSFWTNIQSFRESRVASDRDEAGQQFGDEGRNTQGTIVPTKSIQSKLLRLYHAIKSLFLRYNEDEVGIIPYEAYSCLCEVTLFAEAIFWTCFSEIVGNATMLWFKHLHMKRERTKTMVQMWMFNSREGVM